MRYVYADKHYAKIWPQRLNIIKGYFIVIVNYYLKEGPKQQHNIVVNLIG